MSEEEAIHILTIGKTNSKCEIVCPDRRMDCQECEDEAIRTLLDLYQKEKEKRINLKQELEKRKWVKVKENGEVEPLFYISKDKIREKLKELEEFEAEVTNTTSYLNLIAQRKTLEELLEEE